MFNTYKRLQSGVKHFDLQFEILIQPSIHNELILSLFFSSSFSFLFSFLLFAKLFTGSYCVFFTACEKLEMPSLHSHNIRKKRKKRKDQRNCSPFLIKWWQLFYFIFTFFVRSFVRLNESEFKLQFKNILQHFIVEYGFFYPFVERCHCLQHTTKYHSMKCSLRCSIQLFFLHLDCKMLQSVSNYKKNCAWNCSIEYDKSHKKSI